jgi:hypothetical protein
VDRKTNLGLGKWNPSTGDGALSETQRKKTIDQLAAAGKSYLGKQKQPCTKSTRTIPPDLRTGIDPQNQNGPNLGKLI